MAQRAQEDALDAAGGKGISGSAVATIVSALALAFSGYSFYESVLRSPELAIYVPPRIAYTDPDRPDSPFEVFIIPVTLTNDGARTGTVLAVDLAVTNPRTNETKRFYAAQLGTWSTEPGKPFAPVSLPGKGSYSEALQFFPRADESVARILDLEAGTYRLEISLHTARTGGLPMLEAKEVAPLVFERRIDRLDYRNFNGPGTMEMWADDYRPAASAP